MSHEILFDQPDIVRRLRCGYYTDHYFNRTREIATKTGNERRVTYQVFQKQHAVLCGTDYTIALHKVAAGRFTDHERMIALFARKLKNEDRIHQLLQESADGADHAARIQELIQENRGFNAQIDALWRPGRYAIRSLRDGDRIEPYETVMTIEGALSDLAHLETVYLGALSRQTLVASNVDAVVRAARGKPILFFPARFDLFGNQASDGYAANVGGAFGSSTAGQCAWWGGQALGTTPHVAIQVEGGDVVRTVEKFLEVYPDEQAIPLVDFHNDCVRDALRVFRAFGERVRAVRLDTSGTMVDVSVTSQMGPFDPTGVCPQLVWNVRRALDEAGFPRKEHTNQIAASGGFNAQKIAEFERQGVPVDLYGVGSSLIKGNFDFTSDGVLLDGEPCGKVGRSYRPNTRLEVV